MNTLALTRRRKPMERAEVLGLDPGVRSFVQFLREHGFETTDSGDGVSKVDDPDAMPFPHVFIQVAVDELVTEADRLRELLETKGVQLEPGEVQASYDPAQHGGVLAVLDHDDSFIRRLWA